MGTRPDSTDRRSFLANSALLAIAGGAIGGAVTNADASPDDPGSAKRVIVPAAPAPPIPGQRDWATSSSSRAVSA